MSMAFRDRIEYAALVRDIKKPVIAALKGWVLGGGMEIAIAADIRICGRSAKIGGPEVTRGWLGGGGASQMLPRLIGVGQAMRLLLTGDPVDAETALRLGLVEEVVDDAEVAARVMETAKKIASFSPTATQAIKAAVRAAMSTPLEAGLRYENELHVICMSDKARHEGIKAFQEKRDAKFCLGRSVAWGIQAVSPSDIRAVESEKLQHQIELAVEHVDAEMDGVAAFFGGDQ